MKNGISLAHILLATACSGSPALWAGSFTQVGEVILLSSSRQAYIGLHNTGFTLRSNEKIGIKIHL